MKYNNAGGGHTDKVMAFGQEGRALESFNRLSAAPISGPLIIAAAFLTIMHNWYFTNKINKR